jgi:PknH-like extracellular domain
VTSPAAHRARRSNRLRTLAAAVAGCAVVAACTTTVDGAAKPGPRTAPPASAPTITASLVPASAIGGKLLTRNELAAIIGDTDLQETAAYTKPEYITEGIEPPECGQRVLANNTFTSDSEQRAAMAGNSNAGAAGKRAAQVVSIWASPKDAKQMVAISGEDWGTCKEGQPVLPSPGTAAPSSGCPDR